MTILKARRKHGYKVLERKVQDANLELEKSRANTARSGKRIRGRDVFNYLMENGTDVTSEINSIRESQGKTPIGESKAVEWVGSRRKASVVARDPQRASRVRIESPLRRAKKIMEENPGIGMKALYEMVDADMSYSVFESYLRYSHSIDDPFGQYLSLFRTRHPNKSVKAIVGELIPVLNDPALFAESLSGSEQYPALSGVSSVDDLGIKFLNHEIASMFAREVEITYRRLQAARGRESVDHMTMLETILTKGVANTAMSMGHVGPELRRGAGEVIRATVPGMSITFKDMWEDPGNYSLKYVGNKLVEFFEESLNKKVSYPTLHRWMQREGLIEKRRKFLMPSSAESEEFCMNILVPVSAIVCRVASENDNFTESVSTTSHISRILKIVENTIREMGRPIRCRPSRTARKHAPCSSSMWDKNDDLKGYKDLNISDAYSGLASMLDPDVSGAVVTNVKAYFDSLGIMGSDVSPDAEPSPEDMIDRSEAEGDEPEESAPGLGQNPDWQEFNFAVDQII
jgi:hypothetical protein